MYRCGTDIDSCGMTYFACQSGFGKCSSPAPENPVPPAGSHPPINTSLNPKMYIDCVTPGHFVLGYDDGLFKYDSAVADTLAKKGVKATFFINGYNWADITLEPYRSVLLKLHKAGHQIASHTFDHLDLQTLSMDALYATLRRNDVAISQVIGVAPRYVRAPFGSVNKKVLQALASWGYIVVWQNIKNADSDHADASIPLKRQLEWSLSNFTVTLDRSDSRVNSFISLAHETLQITATDFTVQAIDYIKKKGYKFVNVGECRTGSPSPSNWYRPLPNW